METIIDAQASKPEFTLLVDLGTIIVPDDSIPGEQLKKFYSQNYETINLGGSGSVKLTDSNFPCPTRVIMPGDIFRVRAFTQVSHNKTTTAERLAFLATQDAIHTAQGMPFVFEQKRTELPIGYRYILFHQEGMPGVKTAFIRRAFVLGIFGHFSLELYSTDTRWRWDEAMLCISPVE